MTITLPMTGGCACGKLRYRITAQPFMVTACHCTTCQNRTGSAFSMNMMVPRDGFEVAQGAVLTRTMATASGNLSVHNYCEACLVRTHSEPGANPAVTFVRPGTLDDTKELAPIAQIWTRSAQPWALAEGVRCFEQNMDAPGEMVRAWRAANPVS